MKLEKNDYTILIGSKDNKGDVISKVSTSARCLWSGSLYADRAKLIRCQSCDGVVFDVESGHLTYVCSLEKPKHGERPIRATYPCKKV